MDLAAAANEFLAEECLRASAFVYAESRKRLRGRSRSRASVAVPSAATSMNKSVAEYVGARAREDWLLVELHLLRQFQRDATDRDANRARLRATGRSAAEGGHGDGARWSGPWDGGAARGLDCGALPTGTITRTARACWRRRRGASDARGRGPLAAAS